MSSFRFVFTQENTYCISVESCPERWNNVVNRLKYFDMGCTRWKATTPDTLTKNFVHFKWWSKSLCGIALYIMGKNGQ
jgi:hypothetical protein